MDAIAFMIGEIFIYWNSVILTLAAAAAVCLFVGWYLHFGGSALSAAAAVPAAMVLSLVLARFFHWYSRWDSYAGFGAALMDYSAGGYALLGVFAGCVLTALAMYLAGIEKDTFRMLDAMCLGGGIGIASGRLACFYSAADRGQILPDLTKLPWAAETVNAVSGAVEYRLATFLIQAAVTAAICTALSVWAFSKRRRTGDITLLFLLFYSASQVVLDSTRYDSLYFRSNGFVSIVQVCSAVTMAVCIGVFSLRFVRAKGFRKWYFGLWAVFAALFGCAGYMEYHVQRHGDQAVFAYSIMSACLLAVCALAVWVYTRSLPRWYLPAVPEAE